MLLVRGDKQPVKVKPAGHGSALGLPERLSAGNPREPQPTRLRVSVVSSIGTLLYELMVNTKVLDTSRAIYPRALSSCCC